MNPREFIDDNREKALRSLSGALRRDSAFEDLSEETLEQRYRTASCGWRCDQTQLRSDYSLDILIPRHFPDDLPDVYLSDPSLDLFLENPHVSSSGKICIAPDLSSLDTSEPVALVRYAVKSADKILSGEMAEDFLDEFTSYWNSASGQNTHRFLLVADVDNLPDVAVSVVLRGLLLVGLSLDDLNDWRSAYIPDAERIENARKCLVVRLSKPLSPTEYPKSTNSLTSLLRSKDQVQADRLESHLCDAIEFLAVLFVQTTDDGVTLAGVLTKGQELAKLKDCVKGFREGKVPRNVMLRRGRQKLEKGIFEASRVQRVDHAWIHSRGGTGRTYSDKHAILLGCGSLGGYIAHLLARAGIGSLTLVDNDNLEWGNVGRHILGAGSVGQNKAVALSKQLQREMPHLSLFAASKDWRDWVHEGEDMLLNADIIVSTMAHWNSERLLNSLAKHLVLPPLLFGWLEPYAVAAHVLGVRQEGGCLACETDNLGHFGKNVVEFTGATLSKEPGGCTHYQRYGPVDLWPAASMIVDVCLLNMDTNAIRSTLHTLIQSEEKIAQCGATVSKDWKKTVKKRLFQQIHSQEWPSVKGCQECS